ncbi:hypothetical protein [uncultured Azohydromonas sp.]|jgi:hypothetical protein|uniref:hypothetical protein n=1 Tax=uncultured Azohydromonas sp. TaxID=487342 RepID=UPI002619EE0A|nr:hypothetical protein [uncultured Azohydromonas sp.]
MTTRPCGAGQRGDKVLAYLNGGIYEVLSITRTFSKAGRGWQEKRARRALAADELGPGVGWQGYSLPAWGNQNVEIAVAISSPGKGERSTRDPGTCPIPPIF